MHAIAFICTCQGKPAVGVFVQVVENGQVNQTLLASGQTNQDGYVLFNHVPNSVNVSVFVWGAGYKNFSFDMQLGDTNKNYQVPLEPSFSKPSRDRIINVKANLCNIYDAFGLPIFDAFIGSLIVNDPARAEDWFIKLREAGSTHINTCLSGNYPPYAIPGLDSMNNLSQYDYILRTIRQHGFIPIVKLAFDGHVYDPYGWTYGWQYGMDNIERIATGLSDYVDSVLWSTGFDGCFPDWTPDQTVDMLRKMRAVLGEKACIDTEFAGPGTWGYIHMGNGAADWTKDKLGILDHFSLEAETFPPDTGEGLQEIATRLLGPNCLIGPQTPYYLAGLDKYIAINVYETWAYKFIRKQSTPAQAVETANQAARYGFHVFGNGLPSA